MKVILNKYGESLELDIILGGQPFFYGEPLLVVGKHSCAGQMTLQAVAPDWMALVCRSCSFRKLIPVDVCKNNLVFARFFADIVEKTKENLPRKIFVKQKIV